MPISPGAGKNSSVAYPRWVEQNRRLIPIGICLRRYGARFTRGFGDSPPDRYCPSRLSSQRAHAAHSVHLAKAIVYHAVMLSLKKLASRVAFIGWMAALSAVVALLVAPRSEACTHGGRTLKVGFYSDFKPVSYSEDRTPGSPGFDVHRGYEADLLTALEALEGAGLSFSRRGIGDPFSGIWLKAARPEYDVVGGGITIREDRTRNNAGKKAVVFTSGHISFLQTLLVRAADKERLASYDRLTSTDRVGVVAETTGEERLLQLTGLTDEKGVLAAGTKVAVAGGAVGTADGGRDYFITAAGESDQLKRRTSVTPAVSTMPQVRYYAQEGMMLDALKKGEIDAVARGNIGNSDASAASGGALVIAVQDPDPAKRERGGFALDATDTALAACLDRKINLLTDNGRIDYSDWRANPSVFTERARTLGKR